MKQVFLKFTNKQTGMDFIADYSTFDKEGNFIGGKDSEGYSVSIVGTIYAPSVNPEDSPVALEGWHVNMLVPDDFHSIYEVFPVSPRQIFAGWE